MNQDEIAYEKYLSDHHSKFIRIVGEWKVLDVCPMDFKLWVSFTKMAGLYKEYYETTIRIG